MAATGTPTPNIGLRIPQGTDPASVADINYNSTVIDQKVGPVGNTSLQEQINSAEEAMAYVVNGNDAPSGGIPSGKYVYVKNNTNGIATGMYITTAAISSGATVQASSLSACSEGAVNSLNQQIGTVPSGQTVEGQISSLNSNITKARTGKIPCYGFTLGQPISITPANYKRCAIAFGIWASSVDSLKIIPFKVDIPANSDSITINSVRMYDVGEVTSGTYDVDLYTTWADY